MLFTSKSIWFLFFILLGFNEAFSQTNGHYVKIGNDTVYMLRPVNITVSKKTGKIIRKEDTKHYKELVFKIKKVYPIAVLAGDLFAQYNAELANVKTEAERRKIMKKIEKELVAEYGGTLRNLYVSEGRILLKLIDRETGSTPFFILDDMRGAFSAAVWQGVASLFGHTLKAHYEPYGEDAEIEEIVLKIEHGEL